MTASRIGQTYDVIVVGGSYSGLAAGMALGRARRRTLIIDSGRPCNASTPHSHNFLTQDGRTPAEIADLARRQVQAYPTVEFMQGAVVAASPAEGGFVVHTEAGVQLAARKLVFASGIRDEFPAIPGLDECWAVSALHCPYCHGYEVRDRPTAVLAGGEADIEFAAVVANWTDALTLLTNGEVEVAAETVARLEARGIALISKELATVDHEDGRLTAVTFADGSALPLDALYIRPRFEQRCPVPGELGCELTPEGYIRVDAAQRTSVRGVYACGDNASAMRTLASAVAAGTAAGMMVNKDLALDAFYD